MNILDFPKVFSAQVTFFFLFLISKQIISVLEWKKEGEKDLITCSYSELVYIA